MLWDGKHIFSPKGEEIEKIYFYLEQCERLLCLPHIHDVYTLYSKWTFLCCTFAFILGGWFEKWWWGLETVHELQVSWEPGWAKAHSTVFPGCMGNIWMVPPSWRCNRRWWYHCLAAAWSPYPMMQQDVHKIMES